MNTNCEMNLPHCISALWNKSLTKVESVFSCLCWTPAQLFLLIISAIVVTIAIQCISKCCKKKHNAHYQNKPKYEKETTFGRDSMDTSNEFKKGHSRHAENLYRKGINSQSIHQTSRKSDNDELLRICIKTK